MKPETDHVLRALERGVEAFEGLRRWEAALNLAFIIDQRFGAELAQPFWDLAGKHRHDCDACEGTGGDERSSCAVCFGTGNAKHARKRGGA